MVNLGTMPRESPSLVVASPEQVIPHELAQVVLTGYGLMCARISKARGVWFWRNNRSVRRMSAR